MSDNVNIIVQDTINDIVVNTAVVVETIDINVQVAVDEVNIIANPNNYVININRIIGEQVQSDWDQTDNQAPDYIKNKPTIPTGVTKTSELTNDGENGVDPFITANDVTPQVNSDWDATSGVAEILNKPTIPAAVTNTSELINDGEDGINPFITAANLPTTVTSVGLTMPSAFSVANSPITSAGTLTVTGAGVVSQYVRGDGSLANFPTSTGGGASVYYYLNGSVSQGTIGGVAYKEMNSVPIIGTGTDFNINADGYIAQFITDVGDPNKLLIPAGNWNFETYFSASSGGGSPRFYIELYKYDGSTFTLISSNSATPENITGGTSIDLYFTALAIPPTTLLATDRLAVRFYVIHSGRTITMHTENSHLSQIITTFSTGLTALNGLTTQVQSFATGTSGTDFGISSAISTHTFNLPTASATNRGALSTTDWSTFNGKFTLPSLTSGSVLFSNGTTIAQDNANLFWNDTNNRLGINNNTPYTGVTTTVNGLDIGIYNSIGNEGNLNVRGYSSLGGLSRGAYGAVGSNYYLDSANSIRRRFADAVSVIDFSAGGFLFKTAAISTANSVITLSELMRLNTNGNFLINTTTDNGGKLQIKAPGALSTDIALKIRNSADTADLATIGGNGDFTIGNTNPSTPLKIGINSPVENIIRLGISYDSLRSARGAISWQDVTGQITSKIHTEYDGSMISMVFGSLYNGTYNSNNLMIIRGNGNVGIGTTSPVAKLQIDSTTQGVLFPRMTTTQKNAIATPATGLVVFDTTLNKLCVRGASAWETITSI